MSAPGGVFKAIKFVQNGAPDATRGPATQELEALQRVKTLRHPFILSLDRLEVVDGVLLIIMELADESLYELHAQAAEAGHTGIPRDELLGYLVEAAEALDWMNFEHNLQHLDVKPHNLFLVSNHVKVADFGLVSRLGDDGSSMKCWEPHGRTSTASEPEGAHRGGATPLYSAPELLRGTLSRHSDQYSLAVVYQQLLTGTVPFWHTDVYELLMQHLSATPDLDALPEQDRPAVNRALAKVPEQRFPSCMEFLHALLGGQGGGSLRQSGAWRRILLGKNTQADPPRKEEGGRRKDEKEKAPASDSSFIPHPSSFRRQGQAVDASGRASGARGYPEDDDTPPAAGPAGSATPAPTAVTLPGFRFLTCLHQGPLGDVWRAEDSAGRPRRALCALNFVRYDARLIAHLKTLRDPALPGTEVHWSPAERLVILTESYDQTLRELFDQRRTAGQPGLPRAELLRLLHSAAEALDALYARHGLQHLGIQPRNLLVDGKKLWIAEFGIIPLVWLPTGQTAAVLNGRYAALELFDRRPSRTADQYSLALIYAEMLTGVHPRPQRPGSGSHGAQRRPGKSATSSGLHRPATSGARSGLVNRQGRIDLDLVDARDREVILKALADDPEQRYDSCVAFITALEQAGQQTQQENLYHTLPPVIPYATLMGEPAAPDLVLPPVDQLVAALKAPDPRRLVGPQNARYLVQPDGTWEYRFPLELFPGAMQLKIDGFRDHWHARIAEQQGDSYRLHIVEVPRSFWERRLKLARRLEVEIRVDPLAGAQSRLTEATVRVRCSGERAQTDRILATLAPQVFDTARLYFQATPEQRVRERLPLEQPVRIHPVLPDLELAEVLEGKCQNISSSGIRIHLPKPPAAEYLYLHLYAAPAALGYAILAHVARVQETAEGFELGATFANSET